MSQFDNIVVDVNNCVLSWKEYLPELAFLCHYDMDKKSIVIDLIKVPASRRRQGICRDILDEVIDIAFYHKTQVMLLPDDKFGTPLEILHSMYQESGFRLTKSGWMQYSFVE